MPCGGAIVDIFQPAPRVSLLSVEIVDIAHCTGHSFQADTSFDNPFPFRFDFLPQR